MSDSRERFEAWWLEDAAPVMHASLLAKNEFNEYADFRAQCAYETWQAAERDALERAAKELHGRLMRGDVELGEAYLRLNSVGVPPTEAEFLSFIRALAGKE